MLSDYKYRLFRGWDNAHSRWQVGYVHVRKIDERYEDFCLITSIEDGKEYRVNRNSVSQATGSCDRCGNPIFEGDIVKNLKNSIQYHVCYYPVDGAYILVEKGGESRLYLTSYRAFDLVTDWGKGALKNLKNESMKLDTHYKEAVVEPVQVMQQLFSPVEFLGFLKGNILKYRLRAGHKKGQEQNDIKKIKQYEKWYKEAREGHKITMD